MATRFLGVCYVHAAFECAFSIYLNVRSIHLPFASLLFSYQALSAFHMHTRFILWNVANMIVFDTAVQQQCCLPFCLVPVGYLTVWWSSSWSWSSSSSCCHSYRFSHSHSISRYSRTISCNSSTIMAWCKRACNRLWSRQPNIYFAIVIYASSLNKCC